MNEQIEQTDNSLRHPLLEALIPLGSSPGDTNPPRLNLEIHERQVIWLLGRSGIGKTTLLRTIARLHETPGVLMKYRGTTFHQIEPRRWRSSMLYVNQKPVLFRGSDPVEAARYQIVVMLMISCAAAVGSMIIIGLSFRRLFTKDEALRPNLFRSNS